jgi:predicted RNase H-like nuclease (RuvC/YqgF family)
MKRLTWKTACRLAALGGLAALLHGCESWYYNEEQDLLLQQQQQQQRTREATARQDSERTSRETAALRADLYAFQESQKQLYAVIDELRQENSARAQEIEKLRSLVASLDSRMSNADGAWRNEMSSFRERLAQDQQKAMTKLTGNLADEMARNLNQIRQASDASRAAATTATQEYTVQAGDTVSAIAKAFNLTPDALRAANGMKGDTIRVGQKLKIPSR